MIRLDAIPITSLPQRSKIDVPGHYAGRVNCILHSGQLSDHHKLEVQVNGVFQTGVSEGGQSVFTWQFFQASDEVRIALLNRGVRMKHWQGCWNERDAILHAGTLPIQVFFDGKPQPLLEAMIAPVSSASSGDVSSSLIETVNGNGHMGTVVLEREQEESATGEGVAEQRTVIVQDLLVIAAPRHIPDIQQEREENSKEDQQEEDEREEVLEDERDEDQWEEERALDEDRMEGGDVVQQMDDVEEQEAVIPHAEVYDLIGGDEQHPIRSHVAGRHVAAFHASSLVLEKTLQSLKDLLATMPSKTLIVDVRPNDRQKKKYQEQDGLSKNLLRSVFGAKYWDRVWAIQIVSQMISTTDKVGFSTWRYRVDKPESHPDGIPSLVKKLEEGYSIVVIDSIAMYAESRRRAVIDELQQRVPALDVGRLG